MANRLLGVISALPEEFAHLSDQSAVANQPGDAHTIGGLSFWRGRIAGREAVFVESGAGKVNAGVATSLLLDRFDCRALMLCGVAGGLDPALGVGDVVVGTSHIQHDYGTHREGYFLTIQPGSRPSKGRDDWKPGYPESELLVARLREAVAGLALEPLPAEVGAGTRTPGIHFGTILTGDSFINAEDHRQRLHGAFAAKAVEMEGGAVAQVARRWGDIPFVNVRCLSDLAGRSSHLDFRAFLPIAAKYASQVAHRLAPAI
jgi:adenosylhomocysteine nucleosidase